MKLMLFLTALQENFAIKKMHKNIEREKKNYCLKYVLLHVHIFFFLQLREKIP